MRGRFLGLLTLAAAFGLLLGGAQPAYAQFGGLGKSLKKKVKKETVGRVTDRHDKVNKKLHDLLDEKVSSSAKFANAEQALAEIDRILKDGKPSAETYFYLARATQWWGERGSFDRKNARDILAKIQVGVEAVDTASKKGFKSAPDGRYSDKRVQELKSKIRSSLSKLMKKWKGEVAVLDANDKVLEKLKGQFKADWDKMEARDKAALDLLKAGEEALKAGDTKKAEEQFTLARAAYVKIIKPKCESQDDLLKLLAQGTGLRIANAFVGLFEKTGDGAGILREAELLERSRDLLSFEEEEKIFLYEKLQRGRVDGFKSSYFTFDPSWKATAEKARKSQGSLAKRLLTNLKGYNPDSRNRMAVIEGFEGYKGQLVWWSETLTKAAKGTLSFDTTYKDVEYYDCRETKKIKQITSDGRFIYEQKCKSRKVTRHRGNFVAKTVDPKLPKLAKGWRVSVAGTIAKLKGKKEIHLTGAHVMWVKNPEGKLIWAYGVDI